MTGQLGGNMVRVVRKGCSEETIIEMRPDNQEEGSDEKI